MKKFGLIYLCSFITYIAVILASPYITAKLWADLCMVAFVLSLIYQVCYIFFLRKKENTSIKRSIARFFLFGLSAVNITIVGYYIHTFFNGYVLTTFLSSEKVATYYGFEAWSQNAFANIVCIPVLVIFIAYLLCYILTCKKLKHKSNIDK